MKALFITLLTLFSTGSLASVTDETFKVSLGGFLIANNNTDLSLTGPYLIGTNINLQDDLGMDSRVKSLRLDGYYRFNSKHRFEFSYYGLNTNSHIISDKEIKYRDKSFQAGTEIASYWNMDIYKIAYAYSFIIAKMLNYLPLLVHTSLI